MISQLYGLESFVVTLAVHQMNKIHAIGLFSQLNLHSIIQIVTNLIGFDHPTVEVGNFYCIGSCRGLQEEQTIGRVWI